MAALASYALTAFFLERPLALEAAFKILVLTNLAGFLVFVGTALIYAASTAPSTSRQIYHTVSGHPRTADTIALALLVAGFGTKAGLVPFHGWLPDAHTAAPGPVSALFSGLMVNLGIVAIARLAFQVFTPEGGRPVLGLLMVVGLISAVAVAPSSPLAPGRSETPPGLRHHLADGRTHGRPGQWRRGRADRCQLPPGQPRAVQVDPVPLCRQHRARDWRDQTVRDGRPGPPHTRRGGGVHLGRASPSPALPPLNGYAGVGLIHDSLLDSRQYVPFAVMLAAQVLTVAALGKATWQAFYRPKPKKIEFDAMRRSSRAC